ncbi:MAG TPA: DUF4872 domain-containing protein [Solirubrobacterales bacterium]|nr:DUF4872 domain-containing protein [Solirubrobacterales bacterium]
MSTADRPRIRNLLAFCGVAITEEMALGLGAGPSFYYLVLDRGSPSRFTNGRVQRLEELFIELTRPGLRLESFPGPRESWAAARATVDAGRPALLLTDLYHLDHYGSSARFPGHAVVLAGYDAEVAYLSDTGFEELQTTRLENLASARHGDLPLAPLSGEMVTLPAGVKATDPRTAAPRAIARAAAGMIDPELGEYQGLPALRRFAAEVGSWPAEAPDWQWSARFCYQVIERRGTGGGNFRAMYSRFLDEVAEAGIAPVGGAVTPAAEAAQRWSELAARLLAASEEERPSAELWEPVADAAAAVLAAEERLWLELASAGEPALRP